MIDKDVLLEVKTPAATTLTGYPGSQISNTPPYTASIVYSACLPVPSLLYQDLLTSMDFPASPPDPPYSPVEQEVFDLLINSNAFEYAKTGGRRPAPGKSYTFYTHSTCSLTHV